MEDPWASSAPVDDAWSTPTPTLTPLKVPVVGPAWPLSEDENSSDREAGSSGWGGGELPSNNWGEDIKPVWDSSPVFSPSSFVQTEGVAENLASVATSTPLALQTDQQTLPLDNIDNIGAEEVRQVELESPTPSFSTFPAEDDSSSFSAYNVPQPAPFTSPTAATINIPHSESYDTDFGGFGGFGGAAPAGDTEWGGEEEDWNGGFDEAPPTWPSNVDTIKGVDDYDEMKVLVLHETDDKEGFQSVAVPSEDELWQRARQEAEKKLARVPPTAIVDSLSEQWEDLAKDIFKDAPKPVDLKEFESDKWPSLDLLEELSSLPPFVVNFTKPLLIGTATERRFKDAVNRSSQLSSSASFLSNRRKPTTYGAFSNDGGSLSQADVGALDSWSGRSMLGEPESIENTMPEAQVMTKGSLLSFFGRKASSTHIPQRSTSASPLQHVHSLSVPTHSTSTTTGTNATPTLTNQSPEPSLRPDNVSSDPITTTPGSTTPRTSLSISQMPAGTVEHLLASSQVTKDNELPAPTGKRGRLSSWFSRKTVTGMEGENGESNQQQQQQKNNGLSADAFSFLDDAHEGAAAQFNTDTTQDDSVLAHSHNLDDFLNFAPLQANKVNASKLPAALAPPPSSRSTPNGFDIFSDHMDDDFRNQAVLQPVSSVNKSASSATTWPDFDLLATPTPVKPAISTILTAPPLPQALLHSKTSAMSMPFEADDGFGEFLEGDGSRQDSFPTFPEPLQPTFASSTALPALPLAPSSESVSFTPAKERKPSHPIQTPSLARPLQPRMPSPHFVVPPIIVPTILPPPGRSTPKKSNPPAFRSVNDAGNAADDLFAFPSMSPALSAPASASSVVFSIPSPPSAQSQPSAQHKAAALSQADISFFDSL